MRRISKTKMETLLDLADKDRTGFIGAAADRDDKIPCLSQILVDMGREMMTDVNPDFLHHGNRLGIDLTRRLRACRKDLDPMVKGLQESMCHLAATTVTGTEN